MRLRNSELDEFLELIGALEWLGSNVDPIFTTWGLVLEASITVG